MRIGINASFARKPNTGIGQVTLNFLKNVGAIHESPVQFFIYLEEDIDLKLPENFTKRIFLPFWKRDDLIRKVWWEKYLLPKKIREDECDVFLSLYQSATIMEVKPQIGFNRGFTSNNKKNKHIILVHDIIPELFPEYLNNSRKKKYWKLTKEAIAKVDKIIAVSHRTEKDLVQHLGVDPEKISVNYPDVDEIYKKAVGTGPANSAGKHNLSVMKKYKLKPGYIYSGGGLEVRKNIEGVIRAYHYLLERNKKINFVHEFPELVISGKLMPQLAPLVTDVEKLVKELNLTKQVKLLDFVPQADLPALYKNASVFVYPSFYEGFGLPVLEAMNQGTPVITSKKSSLPEVGKDAVLYCNPDDIHDIAMVIRNILLNKDLRDTLSRREKERAKEFSWDKFTKKVLNIVESLN